jgi:WD40 repeat protein
MSIEGSSSTPITCDTNTVLQLVNESTRCMRTIYMYTLASSEHRRLVIGSIASASGSNIEFSASIDLPGSLTAFAFQPCPPSTARKPSLLATAFEDGAWILYTNSTSSPTTLTPALSSQLSDGPAFALAWSHDGQYLAIGGTELVQIWDIDTLVQREDGAATWIEERSSTHEPVVTWRPDPSATKPRNGEQNGHAKDEQLDEPSLSWSAEGERLGFAVGKQVYLLLPDLSLKTLSALY